MRIAVAGGTGLVGRYVVQEALAAGHTPVVLARSRGVDLTTGMGVPEALGGAQVVIDVSNVMTTRRSVSVGFFTGGTQNLLAAGVRAGVQHHLALSIVGIDRVDFGYYEGKREQEQLALSGPVPATVLRAAQFHEFAAQILARVRGPVAFVPKQRIQPVSAREVAAALVALAAGEPEGLTVEMVGPEQRELVDLARRLVRARGIRRAVVGVQLPGQAGRAMARGGLLPRGPVRTGHQTFDQWLAEDTGVGVSA